LPGTQLTAAAFAYDQGDGTYVLDFYESSMNELPSPLQGRGTLTIHLQYTCDMGRPVIPDKDEWSFGGYLNIAFTFDNVTMPPTKKVVLPNSDKAIDLGNYNRVVYHGDSITRMLSNKPRNAKKQTRNFKLNSYVDGLGGRSGWNMETIDDLKKGMDIYKKQLVNKTNTAVILGTAAWDLLMNLRPFNMTSHLQACQQMIDHTHKLYPQTKVYWRSVTAIHVHELAILHFKTTRYASGLRARELYLSQKKMIDEHNPTVTMLDLYNATYLGADWHAPGDILHYSQAANLKMINWFYVTPNSRGSW
jgi:hypothetical protein